MKTIIHNPKGSIYEADDFVHGLEVRGADRLLFVAGTMGLHPDWSAGIDLEEQLSLVWKNIRTILESAGMTVDNIVRLTSYLRDPDFADANAKARVEALGGRKIPTTAIVAQTLSEDWLIEIEVIAVG